MAPIYPAPGKNTTFGSAKVANATALTTNPSGSLPSDPAKEDSDSKHDYVVFPIERFPSPPPDTYSPEPRSPFPEHDVGRAGSSRSSDNTTTPPPRPRISLTYPPSNDVLFPVPSDREVNQSTPNADPSPYWLETMLIDVERGRYEVESDLKEAQSEVREAVEEVMKAKGELDREVEEVQGLMHYLAAVVGPEEVEMIVKEAHRDALSEGESAEENEHSEDDSKGVDDGSSDSSSSSSTSDFRGGMKDHHNSDFSSKTSSSSSSDDGNDRNDNATRPKGKDKAKSCNKLHRSENTTEQAARTVPTPRLSIAAAPPSYIFSFGDQKISLPLPTLSPSIPEISTTRRDRTPPSPPRRYLSRNGTIHSTLPSSTSPTSLSTSRARRGFIDDIEEEEEEADDERDHAKPSFKRLPKRVRHKANATDATSSTMIPSTTTPLSSASPPSRKRTRSESSSDSDSDSESLKEVENSVIVRPPNRFSPLSSGQYGAQDTRDARRRKRIRIGSASDDRGADVEEEDSESIPLYVSHDSVNEYAAGPSGQPQSQSQSQSQSQAQPQAQHAPRPHPFGGREPAMLFINGRDIVPRIIATNREHFYKELEKDWRDYTNAPDDAIPPWVVPDAEGSGVDADQDDDDAGDASSNQGPLVAWNDYEVNEEEDEEDGDFEMGEDEESEDELENDVVMDDVGNLMEENDHGNSGGQRDVIQAANGYVWSPAHSAWLTDPSSSHPHPRNQPQPYSAQPSSQASTSQSQTQPQPSSQSQSQSQAGPSQPHHRPRPLERARERLRMNATGQYESYLYDETPEYRARLQREKKTLEEWRNYNPERINYPWQQLFDRIRQLAEQVPSVLWEDELEDDAANSK